MYIDVHCGLLYLFCLNGDNCSSARSVCPPDFMIILTIIIIRRIVSLMLIRVIESLYVKSFR